jgi:rhamnulokinase
MGAWQRHFCADSRCQTVAMTSAVNSNSQIIQCLAVDLGAASGRVVAGLLSNGRLAVHEVARFQTPSRNDAGNRYQAWEIDLMVAEIERGVAAGRKLGPLAGIGIDSWGVDYVLLNPDLHPVGVPVCYRDQRTAGVMERVHERVARQEIYRRTGTQFLPFNTLYQLVACIEQKPEWMRAAEHFLMIPDYLHFRMCGALSNEYTNATTTQMCGLSGEWDTTLMERVGINPALIRSPVAAGTVLGDGKGIVRGIQVIAPGTHDTASAIAGTPLESDDEAYISSGTWSLMGIESPVPLVSEAAMRMNFSNEGGVERRFRVLKNIMGMWPLQRLCAEQGVTNMNAIVKEAAIVESWRSVIDVNAAEFFDPDSMTESIRRFCRRTNQYVPQTTAEMARCIFDSLALSYREVREQIEGLCNRELRRIRIVGGGCRNKLLNQLCADACQLPVIAGPVEASALGNLSAQMMALGAVENLTAARALIQRSFPFEEYSPRNPVPDSVLERFTEIEKEKEPCA